MVCPVHVPYPLNTPSRFHFRYLLHMPGGLERIRLRIPRPHRWFRHAWYGFCCLRIWGVTYHPYPRTNRRSHQACSGHWSPVSRWSMTALFASLPRPWETELTPTFSGIMVPTINTAAEARAVISASKFPPIGVRGQGSPFACFEHGLATPSEYVAKANDSLVMMIQIETVAGVENVDEICQVDGVGESMILRENYKN